MRILTVIVLVLLFGCKKKEQQSNNTFIITITETNQPKINTDCFGSKIDTVILSYSIWVYKDFYTAKEINYNKNLDVYQGQKYEQSYQLTDFSGYKLGINLAGYTNGVKNTGGCDLKHDLMVKIFKNNNLIFERSSNYEIVETITL